MAPEYGGEGERCAHDVEADEGGRRALPRAGILRAQAHLVREIPGRCGGGVWGDMGEMYGRQRGDLGEVWADVRREDARAAEVGEVEEEEQPAAQHGVEHEGERHRELDAPGSGSA